MGLPTRLPLDPYPYPRDPTSQPVHVGLPPGNYVYVMDDGGVLWVTLDALHQHPKVLGGANAAAAAGELTIEMPGVVSLVNNLSGTFQLPPETVDLVVTELERIGFVIKLGAIRKYPAGFF